MTLPRLRPTLFAASLTGILLSSSGMRAQADPLGVIAGETLDITADKLDLDVNKGSALLEGNVKAKLGELSVECNKVEMKYDGAPKVEWAKGTGGVKASFRDVFAKAQAVEVDVVRRKVTLSNGVHLSRGRGWVTADKATLDLVTRKVSLEDVKGSIPVQTPPR
jgi:lipopolysaccharide transport protein LptA